MVGDWCAVRPNGMWASPRNGLSVSRQNGKNGALEIRELFGMVELGERVIHTAHQVKTARKAFRRLLEFFDSDAYPELRALVREIRRTNGQEAILLNNGGQVEFIARSRGSGRGYSGDLLVVDEAQDASEDELAALLPILATSLNPQLILTGTPPGPRESGQVFGRMREMALSGEDPLLGWVEWSALPDEDFTDRGVWHCNNPELGGLLMLDTVEGEFAVMELEYFARERLGVWFPREAADRVLAPAIWNALAVGTCTPQRPVLAVEVGLDRERAVIAAAWRIEGKAHVEIVEERTGASWVPDRLVQLRDRYGVPLVVLDAGTEAVSLAPALEDAGVETLLVTGGKRAAACGSFIDAVVSGAVSHNGDPAVAGALSAARWKDVGEGSRVFSRRGSVGNISALYAVTLALYGLGALPPVCDGYVL